MCKLSEMRAVEHKYAPALDLGSSLTDSLGEGKNHQEQEMPGAEQRAKCGKQNLSWQCYVWKLKLSLASDCGPVLTICEVW